MSETQQQHAQPNLRRALVLEKLPKLELLFFDRHGRMMEEKELEILYQDEHMVAFDKPRGLMVHRSELERHANRFALQMGRDQVGRRLFPVHRLDRPTSGVLLFALHREAGARLIKLFAEKSTKKTYLAIVRGFVEPGGVIDYPLVKDAYKPREKQYPKPALTRWNRLATKELAVAVGRYQSARYSLIEAFPETGRMHQIRRHFAHLRHPIIGDRRYGDNKHNRFFKQTLRIPCLMLSAVELTLPHPFTGATIRIAAKIDEPFRKIIEQFGWESALQN